MNRPHYYIGRKLGYRYALVERTDRDDPGTVRVIAWLTKAQMLALARDILTCFVEAA